MSADWYLSLTDGKGDDYTVTEFNLTYNLGPMLREAGWPTRQAKEGRFDPASFSTGPERVTAWEMLKGTRAADLAEMVGHVVANLEADPERFKALNPENGWGDYEGCLKEMRSFLDAIERWPNATCEAWL